MNKVTKIVSYSANLMLTINMQITVIL